MSQEIPKDMAKFKTKCKKKRPEVILNCAVTPQGWNFFNFKFNSNSWSSSPQKISRQQSLQWYYHAMSQYLMN